MRSNEMAAKLAQAAQAALIFPGREAGTAVCIRQDGLLLTCLHCVAESAEALDVEQNHWLLFSSGLAVRAKCCVGFEEGLSAASNCCGIGGSRTRVKYPRCRSD